MAVNSLIREARFAEEAVILKKKSEEANSEEGARMDDGDVSMLETAQADIDESMIAAAVSADAIHEPEAVYEPEASYQTEEQPDIDEAVTEAERQRLLEEELARLRDEARKQGYEEGYETGTAEARQELVEQIDRARQIAESAAEALENGIAEIEDIAVEIVFEAIAKIMGEAMATRDGVISTVRQVIKHAQKRENMVVRLSPDDYAIIGSDASVLQNGKARENISITADDRVELGGCLLEASGGSLDGRLEIQLQQLRDTLLKVKGRLTGIESE